MTKTFFKFLIIILIYPNQSSAQDWSPLGEGTNALNANGIIKALATDNENNIYAAGMFQYNDSGYKYVAKWDGYTWNALGGGVNTLLANDAILTLATDKYNNVYAAGKYTDSNGYRYVAKWDGNKWTKLGALNANGDINKIIVDNKGYVYAVGEFKNDSGYCYVAKWNDTTWSEVGRESSLMPLKNTFNDIMLSKNGDIITASNYVYRWNDTTWKYLGFLYNRIKSLAEDNNGYIYACGDFTNNMNKPYDLARWNGKKWEEFMDVDMFATGITYGILFSVVVDAANNVYAAGWRIVDSTGEEYIAKWNGASWSKVGASTFKQLTKYTQAYINTLLLDKKGNLYAAGAFADITAKVFVARYGFPLGLKNSLDEPSFSIYPNPAQSTINIESKEWRPQTLSIYNSIGELVYSDQWHTGQKSKELNLSNFSNGIYIMKLGNKINKFVVAH